MSRAAPAPSKAQVDSAIHLNVELEKVESLRPTLDDYVSEGVLKHKPEGKYSIPVDGKRVLQMNEAANRMAAWYGDNQAESPARRQRRAERTERTERKFFVASPTYLVGSGVRGWQYRCEHGHSFGFLPGQPSRHTRPCVRVGCESIATLERA